MKENVPNIKKRVLDFVLLTVIGVAIEVSLSYLLEVIFQFSPEWRKQYESHIADLMVDDLPVILGVTIVVPILEELVFRGVLLKMSVSHLPFWLMNFVQAFLFGVYHGNVIQGAYAFIAGVLFGYICISMGSLLYSMWTHICVNVSGLFLIGLFASDLPIGVNCVIVAVSIFVITLSALHLTRSQSGMAIIRRKKIWM